ncbi:CYTH and CHAD domain-containing protein [Pseudonocardia sp.]|uniref:CYTH and CHAD domain-containing protein n=1 Tax=Pseudonocardia sp. TaxID=60912 RepID=UPI002623051E|nr:CYTH and CHAD domain-containing protein [Pseudonocardia sp.]
MSRSATTTRETERKYDVDEAVVLPEPAQLLDLDAGTGAHEIRLEATYFDTIDLGLLRAGITLRRREGGPDEGWHLKLPAGGDSRDELRLPLGAGGRDKPPAEFVALTRLAARAGPLAPVALLATRRRRWVLSDARGRELVELVEDRVDAHTMGEQTTATSWRELEVELAESGRPKVLDRIERDLLDVGARRSRSGSKLARVLADRLPAARPDTDRRTADGTAGAALLAYLRVQTDRLRAHDPLVRRDAPDSVHQMRVASRRMRSALQAYPRVLDRAGTRAVTEELKWLGTQLSGARDDEVIEQRLAALIAGLPGDLVLGPVGAQLTRSMQRRRAAARETALAALDSDRYLALHDAIDRLIADPPVARGARRPARRELPRGVARAWKRTRRRMRAVEGAQVGPARDLALHEARKAAKRLRYAVEVAVPELGKPAKRMRRRLKELHGPLGDHQDTVVARPVIRELAVQAHLDGGNGFTHGVLHGLESARAERAEHDLPGRWDALNRPQVTRWLTT